MTKKQFRTLLKLMIVVALAFLGLVSYSAGKYVQDQSLEGKVTFSASLAENVILRERTAQRQADGSYKLVEPFVQDNEYILLPGLDVPKDPHIVIAGKTPIPAYLFLEIVDSPESDKLTWSVDTSLWEKVPDTAGDVYVYKDVLTSTPENPIYILADNQIIVSQHMNCNGQMTNNTLAFRVKLIQKYDNADAKQAYNGYKS